MLSIYRITSAYFTEDFGMISEDRSNNMVNIYPTVNCKLSHRNEGDIYFATLQADWGNKSSSKMANGEPNIPLTLGSRK